MAKDLTLKSSDGSAILYPKTVTDLVFDNTTGNTLKSILSTIKEEHYSYTVQGFVNPSTGYISTDDPSAWRRTDYIEVKEGEKFRWCGYCAGGLVFAAFSETKKYLIDQSANGSSEQDAVLEYVVPSNVKYIIVESYGDPASNPNWYLYKEVDVLKELRDISDNIEENKIESVPDLLDGIGFVSATFTSNYYLNSSGEPVYTQYGGWVCTLDYIYAKDMKVKYDLYTNGQLAIACYDKNKTFVSSSSLFLGTSETEDTFTVPDDIWYIRVNSYKEGSRAKEPYAVLTGDNLLEKINLSIGSGGGGGGGEDEPLTPVLVTEEDNVKGFWYSSGTTPASSGDFGRCLTHPSLIPIQKIQIDINAESLENLKYSITLFDSNKSNNVFFQLAIDITSRQIILDPHKLFAYVAAQYSTAAYWGISISKMDGSSYVDIDPTQISFSITSTCGKNTVIVDEKGKGDYTSLEECLFNLGDWWNNHKTVIIKPGTYLTTEWTSDERGYGALRNFSLIGTSRDSCIIKNTGGKYTVSTYIDNSVLKLSGMCDVQNLTIIADDSDYDPSDDATFSQDLSYCLHLDFATFEGDRILVKGCRLINNHHAAIGIGFHKNETIEIVDCEIESSLKNSNNRLIRGAILAHEDASAQAGEVLVLRNNVIKTNSGYGLSLENVYNGNMYLDATNNVIIAEGDGFIFDKTKHILLESCAGNNIALMNKSGIMNLKSCVSKPITFNGKRLVAFGDSITAGVYSPNLQTTTTNGYIHKFCSQAGASLVNNAHSGSCIMPGLAQDASVYDYVTSYSGAADIIWIAGGVNDWMQQGTLGVYGDTTTSTFYGTLYAICNYIHQNYPSAVVIFVTPLPSTSRRLFGEFMEDNLDKYRSAIYEVATAFGYNVVAGNELGMPESKGGWGNAMVDDSDCLHPTLAGHALLASSLANKLLQ